MDRDGSAGVSGVYFCDWGRADVQAEVKSRPAGNAAAAGRVVIIFTRAERDSQTTAGWCEKHRCPIAAELAQPDSSPDADRRKTSFVRRPGVLLRYTATCNCSAGDCTGGDTAAA